MNREQALEEALEALLFASEQGIPGAGEAWHVIERIWQEEIRRSVKRKIRYARRKINGTNNT